MAAGEGRRLRPLTGRWPKPILPIEGVPVIAALARELALAGLGPVTVVTGHLAEQVEELLGDGSAYGIEARYVRQPRVDGSADAVRRAVEAGARFPLVVTGAGKRFRPGDVARVAWRSVSSGAPAALAVERDGATVPLWGLTEAVRLSGLSGPPYELQGAGADLEVATIEIRETRDLTDPLDLVRENFPYLS